MPGVTFHGIRGPDIHKVWPVVYPLIEGALTRTVTAGYILNQIHKNHALAWMIHVDGELKAVMVTRRHQSEGVTWFEVLSIGGEDMESWLNETLDAIEKSAKESGCDSVILRGRRGWVRKLSGHGYRERSVYVEKRIDG